MKEEELKVIIIKTVVIVLAVSLFPFLVLFRWKLNMMDFVVFSISIALLSIMSVLGSFLSYRLRRIISEMGDVREILFRCFYLIIVPVALIITTVGYIVMRAVKRWQTSYDHSIIFQSILLAAILALSITLKITLPRLKRAVEKNIKKEEGHRFS